LIRLDFAPFLTMKKGDGTVADEITKPFRRAAPMFIGITIFQACCMPGRKNPFIRQSQGCEPQLLTMKLICDGERFFSRSLLSV
jgi:hypothetical protein